MCSDFTLRARRAMRSVCAAATCGRAARGRRGGGEDAGGRARREEAGVGGLALGTPAVRAWGETGRNAPEWAASGGGGGVLWEVWRPRHPRLPPGYLST